MLPRSTVLDPKTEQLIDEVVDEFMQNRECFYLLDITNEVKKRGLATTPPSGFGSHSLMRPYAQYAVRASAVARLYDWVAVPVDSSSLAVLYIPQGTPATVIDSHARRTVIGLLPVELVVNQSSTQGRGAQIVSTQPAPTPSANPLAGAKSLGKHVLRLLSGK